MIVDLILHGVPNGQDVWGANDDSHYFSTFYVQKDEKEILTIEIRNISGKSYCYYNYLKYNGVTASDERAGAYLGITLRFDAYYKDVMNVYRLCEIIYNNLLEAILVKNGDNVKFKISKFEDADHELIEIRKKIYSIINLSAAAKDFTPINDSFLKNDGKIIKAFLLDCTQDNVMQALIKYGKVAISKYYPSVNEIKKLKGVEERYNVIVEQKDKELQNANKLNEDLKKGQNALLDELENKKDEIFKLNNLVSEKEGIIKKSQEVVKENDGLKKKTQELKTHLQEKEQEINRLKTELQQYKDNRKLSDLVKDIKEPLNTLAAVAGRQLVRFPDSDTTYTNKNKSINDVITEKTCKKNYHFWQTTIWQIVKMILLVLILCSSFYCLYKLCYPLNNQEKKQAEHPVFIKETKSCAEIEIIENIADQDNDILIESDSITDNTNE